MKYLFFLILIPFPQVLNLIGDLEIQVDNSRLYGFWKYESCQPFSDQSQSHNVKVKEQSHSIDSIENTENRYPSDENEEKQ